MVVECFAGADGLAKALVVLPGARRVVELPDLPAPAIELLSAFWSLEALAGLVPGLSSIGVVPWALFRVVLGACALGSRPALR